MTGALIRKLMPNGGHLVHAVPERQHTALCGYAPSSPNGFRIRSRGRWRSEFPNAEVTCKKCLARLPDFENLTTEGDNRGKAT